MTDDLTIFQFDVDAATVRTLVDAIPGLGPEDIDELGLLDEPPAEGTEATDSQSTASPATERTGPRVGETPPPGAGDTVELDSEPAESEGGRKTFLLAGAGVTALAALAGGGFYLYRRRTGDAPDLSVPDIGVLGDDSRDQEAERRTREDRVQSAVDGAPMIGMALLAVGGAVVRRVRSSGDAA